MPTGYLSVKINLQFIDKWTNTLSHLLIIKPAVSRGR